MQRKTHLLDNNSAPKTSLVQFQSTENGHTGSSDIMQKCQDMIKSSFKSFVDVANAKHAATSTGKGKTAKK